MSIPSMENKIITHIDLVSRLLLGFLFIYHGLVPKILWLNDTEIHLVTLSGSGISAEIASPIAGIIEIVLGGLIIFYRKTLLPIYVSALALFLLLLFVGVTSPNYLIEAFNPVTTNILGLGFCYLIIIIDRHKKTDSN